MKKYIIFTLLFIYSISYGQNLSKEELIGTWNVEKISGDFPEMPEEQQKIIDTLKAAFLKSLFEFRKDNTFNLNIEFIRELDEMMKSVHWKLYSNKNEIIIQEWKDKDTDKYQLMEIIASKKHGKIYFSMTESPFILEMKKN